MSAVKPERLPAIQSQIMFVLFIYFIFCTLESLVHLLLQLHATVLFVPCL